MTADVEDESLLACVFQDCFPDSWKDNADLAAYLSELSSFGVDELGREEERLAEERARVLEQTRHLAFSDYQTFIRTADCTERIYRDFGRVEASVSRLLDKLPALAHRCRRFAEEAEQMSARRATNTLTLKRHTEILEILEIPQLMDTCVRNAYYEQALELAAYVRRLDNKHGSNPLIQGLVREVRESSGLMRLQLQQQLRSEAQLSSCLRAVGLLRRADAPDEAELRVKFLRARGAWLRSALDAVPDAEPYAHASKSAEAARAHLFDVLTQYRAVFSEPGHAPRPTRVLRGWLLAKVCELTESLERDLQRGASARLDSLAPQCMYFGLSFGRVGADFRGRLADIFPRAAAEAFGAAAREAAEGFRRDLGAYTPAPPPPTPPGTAAAPVEGTVAPPHTLLDFPPLARFLNRILVAFNDLRLCCPLALARRVTLDLHLALADVSEELSAFHRAEDSALSDGERSLFARMCRTYARDLLPFLDRCLQILFPARQMALILGVPASGAENVARVDVERLLEPLDFLPPEDEPSSEEKATAVVSP
ncbi:conserved oligomeric Golgi complex subunit 8 [Corythoichthys intestinalis]|uniref:conserved oligomeric Golgi complex subunit 8 n=1 Tax=Corythoichthys intestinalis TaxID=161448 RepID=UPI0025A642CE|nr:conserved oligomeric Golgi complex subunit 8 [Corythoichthys intestinalis]XP_061796615.1 conserved oligomeric Golgi complex subunit 8-like [Nerophis lumbriciformis]